MARREEQHDWIDPNLDTPSEANTQKHVNFLEEEEKNSNNNSRQDKDEFSEERKKQWEEGIAEGKKRRDKD